ncbi:RNA polymerase sigma factor [Owenweeksia hongkongensis]|uniref:RNA polymerase sigma factor n=1 Tax=Owenweeksia hongkongensis TaxID=253245 RepID=UPI003A8E28E0
MANSYSSKNAQEARVIISGVQSGDRQQFEKLYDNYAPLLLGVISRVVEDERLAAEVLKDTFIKIRKDMIDGHCSADNLCTWMLSTARNLSLKVVGDRKLDQQLEETAGALELVLQRGYTVAQASEKLGVSEKEICKALHAELTTKWTQKG